MSDEIKEKNIIQKSIQCLASAKLETTYEVARDIVLDYITNLQTIEREYSNLLSENAELQQKYDKALSDLVKESHKRMELSKNYDRLNNIINQLKKYIGQEWYCFDNESIEFKVARDILDKLKELKENNRE